MKLRGLRSFAFAWAMSELVLAGLPTTSTFTWRSRDLVESLALRRENLRVGEQQILALHAGAARAGADEHGDVAVPEGNFGIVGGDDLVQRREGAVVELHHDALQAGQSRRDFEQMQVHGLIRTQHLAGGDAEGEGITDLTGGAGDRDVQGGLHGDAYL